VGSTPIYSREGEESWKAGRLEDEKISNLPAFQKWLEFALLNMDRFSQGHVRGLHHHFAQGGMGMNSIG
jgi:hypothetical protein